jgi:hypothetical protein
MIIHRSLFINIPVIFGGLAVGVLAIAPKVLRFKPSQRQWIFKGDKSAAHLPSEGK